MNVCSKLLSKLLSDDVTHLVPGSDRDHRFPLALQSPIPPSGCTISSRLVDCWSFLFFCLSTFNRGQRAKGSTTNSSLRKENGASPTPPRSNNSASFRRARSGVTTLQWLRTEPRGAAAAAAAIRQTPARCSSASAIQACVYARRHRSIKFSYGTNAGAPLERCKRWRE